MIAEMREKVDFKIDDAEKIKSMAYAFSFLGVS
jgi:hypothetical protein